MSSHPARFSPASAAAPDAAASLRLRLRADTRAEHSALDAFFDGMTDSPVPDLYARFVAMNAAAFAGLVPAFERSPLGGSGAAADFSASLAALEADRTAMGLAPLDPPAFEPARPDLPRAVGMAYVLEGSKLGARFLNRRLAARAGAWPGASFRYLAEADDGRPLAGFMADLTADGTASDHPDFYAACLDGATRTFGYFEALALRLGDESGPRP